MLGALRNLATSGSKGCFVERGERSNRVLILVRRQQHPSLFLIVSRGDVAHQRDIVPEPARPSRVWPIASLAAAGCLWGTGFLFGKIAFAEMSVSENVGYRFIFGSLGLSPILWKSPPKFHRRAWGLLVLASIVGVPILFLLQFN